MKKYRTPVILLFAITLVIFTVSFPPLAVASNKTTYYRTIEKIESHLEKQHWEEAYDEVIALEKAFHKGRWKLQLLGDEREYEQLEEEIEELKVTIQDQDHTQSKIALSSIKTILKSIYKM